MRCASTSLVDAPPCPRPATSRTLGSGLRRAADFGAATLGRLVRYGINGSLGAVDEVRGGCQLVSTIGAEVRERKRVDVEVETG